MPPFGPISRRKLLRNLRKLGFEGPYPGGNHQYLVRSTQRLRVPNPHAGDVSKGLLSRLLKQAGVSREEWEKL